MGFEKQGSKTGNYVGGFLQMFDWNAKSRKKLFSSKSDLPEQSKQKKRCDGNFPTTRFQMFDEEEIAASIKNSSDYSCASSIADEEFYGTKRPGVVAKLMGLDSMPKSKSNINESPYSTPFLDSRSLPDSYYRTKNFDPHRDSRVVRNSNVMEKFQTEILPPKSAKSIPITHNKLLSPIKRLNFIPFKDAAHVMEAAARIIEPGPHLTSKTKFPQVGSSAIPLKVRDLKEKIQSTQKTPKIFEASSESSSVSKNWSRVSDLEETSSCVKNKGKSISLALQAKANVQKRERMNSNTGRSLASQKETSEYSPNRSVKSQPVTQKSSLKKTFSKNDGSNVLRQNNQKQNCVPDRGKSPQKSVHRRKWGPDVKDDKKEALISSSERVKKKRTIHGNFYQSEKDQSSVNMDNRQMNWDQDSTRNGTDVVSFTFNAPMSSREVGVNYKSYPDSRCKRTTLLSSDNGEISSKYNFSGRNCEKSDALSTLLEQKLKELSHAVEVSQQKAKSGIYFDDPFSGQDCQGVQEDTVSRHCSSNSVSRKTIECNSLDTAESRFSLGGSKKCLPIHHDTQEHSGTYSLKRFLPSKGAVELSDSAYLISAKNVEKMQETTLNFPNNSKSEVWEFEYVKEILHNLEPMFTNYALGRSREIINPTLFNQLEGRKRFSVLISSRQRKFLFDCVSECLDLKLRKYVFGGFALWIKGLSIVSRKERLVQEIYNEISTWNSVGDSMIDKLVDQDMSGKYGKWTDYENEVFELGIQIQGRILNSLIDEVVADILVL